MGGLIGRLTKPGVTDASGTTSYYDNPGQQAVAFARKSVAPTSVADLPDLLGPEPGAGLPAPTGMGGNPQADADLPSAPAGPGPKFSQQPTAEPKMVKPSFQDLDQTPDGRPAPLKPGMTKLGALLSIIKAGAEGGIAGRAASERAVAASGGHRSIGFGGGYEAGVEEPIERAAQRNKLQQEELQTEVARQNAQPVNTPYGPMPLWKASKYAALNKDIAETRKAGYVTPRNGGVYDTNTNQYAPGTEPQDKHQNQSPLQVYADTVKAKMDSGLRGNDLMADPDVQASLAALKASQPERQQHEGTPEQQYLDAASRGDKKTMQNIAGMWATQGAIRKEYMKDPEDKTAPHAPTRGEFQQAEVRKNKAFDDLEKQYRFDAGSNSYVDEKTGNTLSADEFNARKQRIQDNYEHEVSALTGNQPQHVDMTTPGPRKTGAVPAVTKGASTAAPKQQPFDISKATRTATNPKTKEKAYFVGGQWVDKNGNPFTGANQAR